MATTITCDLCGRDIRTVGLRVSLIEVAGRTEVGERDACGDYCVPCLGQRVNQLGGGRPDFGSARRCAGLPLSSVPAVAGSAERITARELADG